MKIPDILIIGGGIIGCACARALARNGLKVSVLEARSHICREATGASLGVLSYFPSASNPEQWHALAKESITYHEDLEKTISNEVSSPPQWNWRGHIRVATSAQSKMNLKKLFKQDNQIDNKIIWLDKKGLRTREPALNKTTTGGVFSPRSGWINPTHLTEALALSAKEAGAHFHLNTKVRQILWDDDRIIGCSSDDNQIWKAGFVLIASGAWSGGIDKKLDMAIEPIIGEALHLDIGEPNYINHLLSGKGIHLFSEDNGVTVGSTYERRGFIRGTTAKAVHKLLARALFLLPELEKASWEKTRIWSGLRPCSPNRVPLIGRDPRYKNLYWATGHYTNGVLMAPLTAHLIKEALSNGNFSTLLTANDHPLFSSEKYSL